jgi:hypothetical protein
MIPPGPDVQRVTISISIRKGRTPISRAPCFAEPHRLRFGAHYRRAAQIIGLAVLIASSPRRARAADADLRTVVIMSEAQTEAVSQRLRQEIEALGFQVEFQPETEPLRSLEAVAAEAHAMAAIRVESSDAGGVEMTVLDRVTGKTVHRALARATDVDPAGEELVATRTVELFRASLMELSADHPARGDVPAAPPVRALLHHEQEQANQRAGSVALAVGPALLLMPEWQPSAQLWISASWLSTAGFGVNAVAFTALSAAHLARAEGAVDLTARIYRLGVTWALRPKASIFSARFNAGWSLTTLSLQGTASAPYAAAQAERVAWGPWSSASMQLRLLDHFALVAEVSGALSVPTETVRFAGRSVANFAEPAFLAALGPELFWP